MDQIQTPERMELVERVAALGPQFTERAPRYDREAVFPTENWRDLADNGFLGLCAPIDSGGLGGDFVTYALVSEELGRHPDRNRCQIPQGLPSGRKDLPTTELRVGSGIRT